MDRPFAVEAATSSAASLQPSSPSLIGPRQGSAIIGAAFAAAVLGGALGHATAHALATLAGSSREVAASLAQALTYLVGGSGALTVVLHRIPTTALRDRVRGCAWFGAPDPAVSHAFLIGGSIAVFDALLLVSHATRQGDWPVGPAMLLAFAAIAVVPVLEELLLRGLLFAMLRSRIAAAVAVTTAVVASAPLHALGVIPHHATAPAAVVLGAGAMALRLRHASLAPAIAMNCGAAFIRCVLAALG